MAPAQQPPIIIPAVSPPEDVKKSAAIIFMHGLGDDAFGWQGVAQQFQGASKLPHMQWIFPNAPENRDAMEQAWFTPSQLSPFPSSRPELDDPEDEDGMKQSLAYVTTLIDDLVSQGVPTNRIVVGGFSQGCAMTFLTGLLSKYSGKLAGLVGLAGYLPLAEKIKELRAEAELPQELSDVPIFLMRGSKDMLVPRRYYSMCIASLKELGVSEDLLELHEYEGLGHSASGAVFRDMCAWLEKIVPPLEQ